MYPVSQGKAVAYDKVATMFSPDGRLYQVEYASKIVAQGTLGCALTYSDGVLFGTHKKIPSKLLLPESIEKVFKIDEHMGAISSGLVGDARRLIELAREKAQQNIMYYDEPIHVETLVKHVCAIKQAFTQYGGMRPFGVSLVIGGIDDTGFRLFETEPSGALAEYKAIAIGNKKKEAMKVFESKYKENMGFDDAVSLTLDALEKGLDEKEKLDVNKLEFAFVDRNKFSRISRDKIKSYLTKSKK